MGRRQIRSGAGLRVFAEYEGGRYFIGEGGWQARFLYLPCLSGPPTYQPTVFVVTIEELGGGVTMEFTCVPPQPIQRISWGDVKSLYR